MRSSEDKYYIFVILIITTATTSVVFHCLGLASILLYKKTKNQNVILASLSVAEMMSSIQRIVFDISYEVGGEQESMVLLALERAIYYVSLYQILLTMYILTFDRMMCVVDPLKYK